MRFAHWPAGRRRTQAARARAARVLAAALAGAALAGAAGCGFRPLYGGAEGKAVSAALAAVEILPIEGELGAAMRNGLLDYLAPSSRDEPLYELSVRVEASARWQVTEKNTQIRRYLLVLRADYALVDKTGGRELAAGETVARTSYNIVRGENYSTLVAERNAAREAAREAARSIVSRLALRLRRPLGE